MSSEEVLIQKGWVRNNPSDMWRRKNNSSATRGREQCRGRESIHQIQVRDDRLDSKLLAFVVLGLPARRGKHKDVDFGEGVDTVNRPQETPKFVGAVIETERLPV